MAKVALLPNGPVGLEVAKHLKACGDEVVKLYLHDPSQRQCGDEIISALEFPPSQVCLASESHSAEALSELRELEPDFIITVYWSHILKPEFFQIAKRSTLNFHPALLPYNRGWYPHVHSLIDGTPFGVTLHQIEEGADTGAVWVQKELFADPVEVASDLYDRHQAEIVQLFRDNWEAIRDGKITAQEQDHSKAIYRKKKAVEGLDECDLDSMTGRELLQRLKARTFRQRGFAFHLSENGEKIFMHLRLSRDSDFSD